jgi:hypothetical protein
VKMQLRAEYRPEAALAKKKQQVERAIEVTERQNAVISQKLAALTEMKAHLEERLAKYRGWRRQLQERTKAETGDPAP